MTKELPSRIEDAIIEDAIYSLNIALEVLTTFLNESEDEEVINLFHCCECFIDKINSFLIAFEEYNFESPIRRIILLEQPLLDEVIYNVEKLDLGLSDDQMDQLLENIENSLLRKKLAGVAQ